MKTKIIAFLLLLLMMFPSSVLVHAKADAAQPNPLRGVWDNFDFSRSARDWSDAVHKFGNGGVIDLVVAQATNEDTVVLPFPFSGNAHLESYSETDLVEPYLTEFDSENISTILSIQPLDANVTQLIDILLSRYAHHSCFIGVNVDLEWKSGGEPNTVNNAEKVTWINEIRQVDSSAKLFLTYYMKYTYFPDDSNGLVVLFDGGGDTEVNLLKQYQALASHYNSVGIYTGYSSSAPPTATDQRILEAVPKTEYIIHTEDVFSEKPVLIFEMDDIEIDWNENLTNALLDVHLNNSMPVVCGIVPANFDNENLGGGFLRPNLVDLYRNYFDIFQMAQLGFSNNDSELLQGESYADQKSLIEKGLEVLNSIGIKPTSFIPPNNSLDETTLAVAEDLGFTSLMALDYDLSSSKLLVLSSWVSLTNNTHPAVLQTSDQLMAEIDNETGQTPIVIQYSVSDFANHTGTKLNDLKEIIYNLTRSQKYIFMTAEEYQDSLSGKPIVPISDNSGPFDVLHLAVFLSIGVLIAVVSIYVVKKFRALRKLKSSNGEY